MVVVWFIMFSSSVLREQLVIELNKAVFLLFQILKYLDHCQPKVAFPFRYI